MSLPCLLLLVVCATRVDERPRQTHADPRRRRALAQAVPLALGPLLTRLYGPEQFGQYALFAAVAVNCSVVACARYEYALPLVEDRTRARDLMALCQRVLIATTLASCPLAWWLGTTGYLAAWAWLPPTVAVAGRGAVAHAVGDARADPALARARVLQHGGGAIPRRGPGAIALPHGLVVGSLVATAATALALRRPAPQGGWWGLWQVPREAWRAACREHRSFPLLNTPHAFAGALQDTLTMALLTWWSGDAAAGFWGLALLPEGPGHAGRRGRVAGALSPARRRRRTAASPHVVRQVMLVLGLAVLPLVLVLLLFGPALFALLFGERWRAGGRKLSRALAPYIGVLSWRRRCRVVTAWDAAQAWALRLALVSQVAFLGALALGLPDRGPDGRRVGRVADDDGPTSDGTSGALPPGR